MTYSTNRLLVVIDPTRDDQWALKRALIMARGRDDVEITAFVCAHSNAKAADEERHRRVELRRHTLWLQELLAEINVDQAKIMPVVEWHKDWPGAVVDMAAKTAADVVIKHASGRPKALGNSDRYLIRHLHTAMVLVNREPQTKLGTMLAALNLNAEDAAHQSLNEFLLQTARSIRERHQRADLHVVNAYPDSKHFIHPPDLAKKTGVDLKHAHSIQGKPAEVIEEAASDLDADLVLLGNVGRRGLAGMSIGNTAERVVSRVNCDILVISRDSQRDQDAA